MVSGRRKRRWVNFFVIMMKTLLMATLCHRGWLLAETIGDLQSAMSILLFACCNRLVESRGSTNHSGRTAMDTSFHRGWLVSNVCSVAMFFFLNGSSWNSFALWGSWRPDCEHWTVSLSNSDFLLLRACASLCVFSIARCVYIICFVVASFALWFCDCAILLSIALRDNDIKIQRRHTKLEKDELERQLATNDPWAAGTEATELFSAEFHPNVAINTENGVAKTHWSGDWFEGWICARKRRCRFDFGQCEMTRWEMENRWKIEGKSGENLWNAVLLSGILILLDCVCLS